MSRKIVIIKNRSDIGAGTRGSDMGIDALEIAAINKGSEYFNKFPFIDVPTRNNAVYEREKFVFGKRIGQVLQQCEDLAVNVKQTILNGQFPLVLSGDHSSAIGTIGGLKAAAPHETIGVVWIDAHADIHSPYTTPSGNLHGMPLAAIINEDNRVCEQNKVDEETIAIWNKLKAIGTADTKVDPKHLVYLGVRDTEEPEDLLMERLHIKKYLVDEVRTLGVEKCVEQVFERLADCDTIYVSFDVDSMDSELISDGTGTPVPKGFYEPEIITMLELFMNSPKVKCLEVVEINPLLDSHGNSMAEVTFEILEQITPFIEKI
jgi:arginase